MTKLLRLLAPPFLILLGFLFAQAQQPTLGTPTPIPEAERRGIVFSIDGSGHLRAMAQDLSRAVSDAKLPLTVEEFDWSHGAGRILSDLRFQSKHRSKGLELSATILARRREFPDVPIYLVSHSSGAAIALNAAENVPTNTIDRIVMLAPAVSASYDLRPALRSSKEGIDVFYSSRDFVSLSVALVGTTDGRYFSSAGLVGFKYPNDDLDRDLYQNLRQISWDSAMSKAGHTGGHFGATKYGFFQAYVVPILAGAGTGPTVTRAQAPDGPLALPQPALIRVKDLEPPGKLEDRTKLFIP